MEKDVEELLRRMEDLQHAHDRLKQNLISRRRQMAVNQLTEAQYFNIFESVGESIQILDDKGCLIYRNPAWEKLYGYSAAESLGKDLIELIVEPKDATIARSILQQVLNGAVHGGEFVVKNKKGQKYHILSSSSSPLRDENGKIIGMLCVACFLTPVPELSLQPKVGAPTTTASRQPFQSNLATEVKQPKTEKQDFSSMINFDYQPLRHDNILSPKVERMAKNGISWSWKGQDRKGVISFDSRTARSCWHWLCHSDQSYEYVLEMISCMPAKVESQPLVNTDTLVKWSSSYDRVYEIKWEDLNIKECIGRGAYGIRYHAVWYGSDVALKLFPKQDCSHDLMLSFKHEVSVMKRLRHPNILLFMGAVASPQHICIVTEFLCRGSLSELLRHRRGRFKMKHHVHMALDIARGMNYLHCCFPPIIYCDLKSSNLRVDKNWTVKISDFGLCRLKHETKEAIRTLGWMAPEVLRKEEADEKSDIYSYGVVLWEMTTEKIPWDGLSSVQVIKAVGFMNHRLDIPKDVDPQWAYLIDRCLCSEPESRPTFQDILDDLKNLQTNIALQVHATNRQ